MTPQIRLRLVQLLGMLGSDQDGERANAVAFADRLRLKLGITWDDLIRPADEAAKPANAQTSPDLPYREQDIIDLGYLVDDECYRVLIDRQKRWIKVLFAHLETHECLTSRQREVLTDIRAKVDRRRRAA